MTDSRLGILALIVIILIFLYPKECGDTGTAIDTVYKDCNCLGLKLGSGMVGYEEFSCYGACLECSCYKVEIESSQAATVDVPCE